MFKRILIANRGEIACRIARTANRLGIETVAVCSNPDRGSPFTKDCDITIPIGGATPMESYLDIGKILKAAELSGAEAIHPGYGFLSENAEFAEQCKTAGLVFIGPEPDAIRIMGLKDSARTAAINSNVPVLPGYDGEDQSPDTLLSEAKKIGYPVLIKAVAGGGGKGMRVVVSPKEFQSSLESVRRESLSAFGNESVLIEKYFPSSLHIEIQVFSDHHGNTVHLFERDCSMQRRYQKVVEESPAPLLANKLRNKMTAAAVNCAKAIGYVGAGTVEFLVDSNQFYFLEMNTRLQVEHPVTEKVTGQDLVEWQLRVAAGEPLPCSQEDIKQSGHAIEVRVYAENPDHEFLPATGTILDISKPNDHFGDMENSIRIDTGIAKGSHISTYYDPMISKVISWDKTREQARINMLTMLQCYRILGVPTNISFLQSILKQSDFIESSYDTQYLTRNLEQVLSSIPINDRIPHFACAWLFLQDLESQQIKQEKQKEENSPWLNQQPLRSEITRTYNFDYLINANKQVLDFTYNLGRFEFEDGVKFDARITDQNEMLITHRDNKLRLHFANSNNSVFLHVDGQHHRVDILDIDYARHDLHDASGTVFSPMPGIVIEVRAKPGVSVSKGDRLLTLEAMKMEHNILAPNNGTVKTIYCKSGEAVTENAPLIIIESK
ncbi:MAG: ATP-grasp domain-containing protein [Gammaproteobacteria bacterium]|nr:ATP-grasp domain-containing protein [Gammaproteobacteria bacterium]MCY4275062.1 ATP-grasp domain-containing protein [Gammaproteobacteria bacterium]